jgi:gliding motility-associated transport system ATP-binding protein
MLQVEGLTKYYGHRRALNEVSFRIEQGEIIGLLGLNGSGKTTLLRILAGNLLPTAGRVTIGGRDLIREPHEVKRNLSFLPETPPLYGDMKVRPYLEFVGRLKGMDRRQLRERLPMIEARTAIEDVRGEIISHLSFGYRQRVAVAMALLHDPRLLLLDEPAAGLDPVQIVEMRQRIRSLRGNHTVILSSHLLSEISQICDRILMIQEGEIIGEGPEEELARKFTRQIRIRMQVRGARSEIEECLRDLPQVEQIAWVKEGNGRPSFLLSLSEDIRETINLKLVNRGLGVLEMVRTDLDLENTFLRLMQTEEKRS